MDTKSHPCLVDVNNPDKVREFTEAFLTVGEGKASANIFYVVGRAYQDLFEKDKGVEYNLNKAVEFFDKAINLNPTDYHSYQAKGTTLERLGSWYFCLGDIGKVREFYQTVIDSFTKAIEIYSDFAWAYNNRGIAHRLLAVRTIGDISFYELREKNDEIWKYLEKAQDDNNKAIELNDSVPLFCFNRACNTFYLNYLILNETGKKNNESAFDQANRNIKRDLSAALYLTGFFAKPEEELTKLKEIIRFWYPITFKYLKSDLFKPYLKNPPCIDEYFLSL